MSQKAQQNTFRFIKSSKGKLTLGPTLKNLFQTNNRQTSLPEGSDIHNNAYCDYRWSMSDAC